MSPMPWTSRSSSSAVMARRAALIGCVSRSWSGMLMIPDLEGSAKLIFRLVSLAPMTGYLYNWSGRVILGDVHRPARRPQQSAVRRLSHPDAPSPGSQHVHRVPHQAAHRRLTAPLAAADTHVWIPDFVAAPADILLTLRLEEHQRPPPDDSGNGL